VPVRDRDWLLARLVARVRAHGGRGSDVYGQTGREEFAVLAPATSEAEALRMADRLSVLLRDQWEQVVAAYRATRPDGASPLGSDALNAPPSPRWAVAVLGDDTTPQGAAARLLTQASRGLLHPAAARGRAAEH
jgi:GGDEF domain-containing protein